MTLHQGVEINIMTPYQGVQTPLFYFHCDIIVSQWEMIVFNRTRLNNDHVKWPQINYNLLSVCCFSLDNLHFNFEIKFFVDVKIVQYRTKNWIYCDLNINTHIILFIRIKGEDKSAMFL